MSIASQIERINGNIAGAYTALESKGASLPSALNSANLADTIESLPANAGYVPVNAKNLLDLSSLTTGKQLNWSTGAITDNANRNISDYIPVTPGKYLVSSYYIRRVLKSYTLNAVCFYDAEKEYLSGIGSVSSALIPQEAVYARVCGNTYMPQPQFHAQIEISSVPYPTFYEPYRASQQGLPDSVIGANRILTDGNVNNAFCHAIPLKAYCASGESLRIYHRNILSHPKYAVIFYTADKMNTADTVAVTVYNYDDYAEFSCSGDGGMNIPYAICDDSYRIVAYGNLELYVTSSDAPSATVLLIGDSTVEQDNALPSQLKALYDETDSELTLLGTRGEAGNHHEGRSGWKAEDYATTASKSSVVNPFWNTDSFDFSYYMAQQNYSHVDAVFIQLGINDLISKDLGEYNGDVILGYIDTMVTSIKAYSQTTQIILDLVIPPNSDGSTFADKYHGTQAEWLYRYNTIRYNALLREYYRADGQVTVLGINLDLDTNEDIRDGVHPATSGQIKIAKTIYRCLAGGKED